MDAPKGLITYKCKAMKRAMIIVQIHEPDWEYYDTKPLRHICKIPSMILPY